MKTLAIFNIKGGVGKTATAVNLGWHAARNGARVLVWDLDPQAASSFYFRIKPKVKGGSKGLVRGKREIDDLIKGTDYEGLDLLPSDFSYRKLDLHLAKSGKADRLARVLKPARSDYDYVLIDCPPSISPLSESIFAAADALLVPMLPSTLSINTWEQIDKFCKDRKIRKLKRMPFFSMVDRRKNLHKEIMARFPENHPEMLSTNIPYSSIVERMGTERAPVAAFAPRSAPAQAYAALWREIADRLG